MSYKTPILILIITLLIFALSGSQDLISQPDVKTQSKQSKVAQKTSLFQDLTMNRIL